MKKRPGIKEYRQIITKAILKQQEIACSLANSDNPQTRELYLEATARYEALNAALDCFEGNKLPINLMS